MWKTVNLGDVCDFQNGFAFKSALFKERGKPILRISNIQNEKIDVRKTVYFDAKDYDTNFTRYEVKPDDLLIAMSGATTGKIGFNKTDTTFYLNQRVGKFKPKPTLDKVFLYYLLSTKVQENLSISKGAAQPNLSSEQIKNISFSLPPLAEQQRIVAKLDAAFAEIDTAIGAAEKNARNAEAIYAYAINAMFAEHSDKAVKIGDYAKINYGYTAKASHDNGEYKFLRITDIQDGTVNWQSVPYCDVESKKISSVLLKDGDIVFARTGATTGKSFLVRNPINAVFASYLIRVSLDKEAFLPDFVLHYFQSEEYWRQVDEGTSGAAQGGFNASKLSRLMLPLIPIDEQINLTEHLNKISQQSSSLKEMYLSKAKKLDTLKSSLLAAELNNMSEAA